MSKKKINLDKDKVVKDTGHEWDGIKELDNPDPFSLRVVFYMALFFALGYWMLYPSWPTPNNQGILEQGQYDELSESLEEVQKLRAQYKGDFIEASYQDILKDPNLYKFAIAGGKAAFQNNCAVCHASGGSGNIGYPNLTDPDWLWGGKFEDIHQTLQYGIRSEHEDSRDSQMAAFGRDGILTKKEVEQITDHVISFYNPEHYKASTKTKALYKQHCASCHGLKGEGLRDFGAPPLNDAIWLYGGDRDAIYDVIYNGRQGVMPYWQGKLDDMTIKQLTIYVHSLGGGE